MDPVDPTVGETLKIVAESYGLPGMVLFFSIVVLLFLTFGLPRLIIAIRGDSTPRPAHTRSREPQPSLPGASTETIDWLRGLRAGDVKKERDRDESQDDKISRLESELEALKSRVADAFNVIGSHRQERQKQIDKLDTRLEEARKDIRGVQSNLDYLNGVARGKSGGSGYTGMFHDGDKSK